MKCMKKIILHFLSNFSFAKGSTDFIQHVSFCLKIILTYDNAMLGYNKKLKRLNGY